MTDQAGAVLGAARYDAWGMRVAMTGVVATYGYTGREPDRTGLVYYRARYYDPSLGRFTQADPLGFEGGDLNLYAYVGSTPTTLIDPLGTQAAGCPPGTVCAGVTVTPQPFVLDLRLFVTSALGIPSAFVPPPAVFQFAFDIASVFPVIGVPRGVIEAGTGVSLSTGEPLPPGERLLGLIPGGRTVKTAFGAAKRLSLLAKGGRVQANREAGLAAEHQIAARFPGSQERVSLRAESGRRVVDVLTAKGLAIESKVGRTANTPRIRKQIQRDLELLRDPESPVRELEYSFSRSGITDRVGPTQSFRRLLGENGIRIRVEP